MARQKNVIEIENLHVNLSGKAILDGASFTINKEDMVAVLGPNGAGKSTLMRIIAGILPSSKGKVKVHGKIGYVPQKYLPGAKFPATVEEILSLESSNKKHRREVIDSLKISDLLSYEFSSLSGGQQQRVMIALSLLPRPEVLILDEPEVGIDKTARENFYKLLSRINKKYKTTILFVTHDSGVVSDYFNKVLCVSSGNVCLDSPNKVGELLEESYGSHFHQLHHSH